MIYKIYIKDSQTLILETHGEKTLRHLSNILQLLKRDTKLVENKGLGPNFKFTSNKKTFQITTEGDAEQVADFLAENKIMSQKSCDELKTKLNNIQPTDDNSPDCNLM